MVSYVSSRSEIHFKYILYFIFTNIGLLFIICYFACLFKNNVNNYCLDEIIISILNYEVLKLII